MKILILCNSDILATNTIYQLNQNNQLAGVVVPERFGDHLSKLFQSVGVPQKDIYYVKKTDLADLLSFLFSKLHFDCLITLTFPWKIPSSIYNQTTFHCLNFHFGLLPTYKGADPVFWQIVNQEQKGGITIHRMNEQIDSGDILHIAELPITNQDTYGMHCSKLAMLAAELVLQLPEILTSGSHPQEIQASLFFKAPDQARLMIHWQTQSAESMVALVNASNPKYHGAMTTIKGQMVRVFEATVADVNAQQTFIPGTIVHADATHGLIVACMHNQFLSLQSVYVKEGYLSGFKLFNLGLQLGDQFM